MKAYDMKAYTSAQPRGHLALSLTEGRVVFSLGVVTYVLAAVFLVFAGNVILGDALARVENVHRILYSRDPHLAAIGFNFPPLPQFFYLPFIPLRALWPPLAVDGFIGNAFSAVFMAGAVLQVHTFLREINVRRAWRLALTATFALHPMVFYSGANGMTEAASLFFLLLATVQLTRWFHEGDVSAQAMTGVALGLAFLTRYEALFSGLAVMSLIAVVTYRRQHGVGGLSTGICDATILGAPFLLAVAGWFVVNWVIAGSPLAEVTNAYGTAQLHIADQPSNGILWDRGLLGTLKMELLLPAILLISAIVAMRRRTVGIAPPLVIFGPILAFMEWSWATGTVLDSLRYLITAVPLATLLAGVLLAPARHRAVPLADQAGAGRRRRLHAVAGAVSFLAVLLALVSAMPVAAAGMWEQQGSGASGLVMILNPKNATEGEQRAARRWRTDREVAKYLDEQHLPRGSVLVDDFAGFAIFLSSSNPDQFVITSDRDFQGALVDPSGSAVEYILAPQPKDIAVLEAVNRTYPGFYDNGGGVAELVKEFPQTSDGPIWRLYRVSGRPNGG